MEIIYVDDLIEAARKEWHGKSSGTLEAKAYSMLADYRQLLRILRNEDMKEIRKIDLKPFLDQLRPERKTLSWEELREVYSQAPLTTEEAEKIMEIIWKMISEE